jgi:mannitol-1-phosphate/altronate dehydrogenase
VAGVDVAAYAAKVRERFANPTVRDQVARIAQDGSGKFPKFLIPTIEAQLDAGAPVGLSALALAGWCQYLTGCDHAGREIAVQYDSNAAEAQRFAQASIADPAAFLGYEAVFGERVGRDPRFAAAFTDALRTIRAVGSRAATERALAG